MRASMREEALTQLRRVTEIDRPRNMRQEFARDPGRASRFSAAFGDLFLDFSKCALSDTILSSLLAFAEAAGVSTRRDAMFAGERINETENRAALHVALRWPPQGNEPPYGAGIAAQIARVLEQITDFAQGVRTGRIRGSSGLPFRAIVNIGIGGSDLGSAMATAALSHVHDGPELHFVSNVDASDILSVLKRLDPATTLFIIASKTFTTVETMTNAATARRWLVKELGEEAVGAHFAAVSTAEAQVREFGIAAERMFAFWDFVGGRYSIWSAIGLPLMIAIGPERFRQFLAGGHAMDAHFRDAAPTENLPMLLGLIGFWHRAILGFSSRAVIPYDQRLARFPAYLQQLDMESNGKGVTRSGQPLGTASGPIVWGEPGTNGQHAFFQLLHQGTEIVPVEFLIAANGDEPELDDHQRLLIANCLAQSESLMRGRTLAEAEEQLLLQGKTEQEARNLAPHRTFPGNRPSLTLLYPRLDPFTLGQLIALYEHRVFVESVLYDINPFDQWGVELGKELATALLPLLERCESPEGHDASTLALLRKIQDFRGENQK